MTEAKAATTLDEVLGKLRANADELRRHGVLHAAVFGSVARGEDRPASDVDILVTFDPEVVTGLLEYVRAGQRLEEIVGRPVDLAERERLKPLVRPNAEREAVDAF
jgi:predicted nucleotidyltransferase